MTTPSLQDVFGPGATQTATTITLQKAELATLTPKADNNGQEIAVSLNLTASQALNPARRAADPDVRVEISYAGQTVFAGTGGQNDQQDTFTWVLHKPVPAVAVDADDY